MDFWHGLPHTAGMIGRWIGLGLLAGSALAGELPLALDATDLRDLDQALSAIKMSAYDLGFKKDIADSELVLARNRGFLARPLTLPLHGQAVLGQLSSVSSLEALALFAREQLELTMTNVTPVHAVLSNLPPAVAGVVQRITDAALTVQSLLPRPDRAAFAAFVFETFDEDADKKALAPDLFRREQALELQEDELADALLRASDQLDRNALLAAQRILAHAVDAAVADLPRQPLVECAVDTPLGPVIVTSRDRQTFTNEAFLIIATGHDNVFRNSAGGANGLEGRPIAIVIATGNGNRYVSTGNVAQGAGVFGIGILADLGTNATFSARHLAQGAGFFGCGLLMTGPGRQTFVADTFCQGAGAFGSGILWQRGGDTIYRAAKAAQGFGFVSGVGLLLDQDGNDSYVAGGKYKCGWLAGHNFSLAQGMGMGLRPFAGGGTGILCDLLGDDRYEADVYGQGASYWYSVGLLLDRAGDDTYLAYQYCQGAGVHLSSGALIDWGGNDTYTARAICQGGAHDYSVGLLIDRAGQNRYTGDSTAQGSAINNSFAWLLDRGGDDRFTGDNPKQSQAAGHDGGKREYGSIAVLLHHGGPATYSQGWTNNAVWLKPWYGVGLDIEATKAIAVGSPSLARPEADKQVGMFHDSHKVATSCLPVGAASPPRPGWQDRGRDAAPTRTSEIGEPLRLGRGSYAVSTGPPPVRSRLAVDVHHPIERLLRRSIRETDTEEHRQDAETAWAELKQQGVAALPYLVTRLDSPNVMVRVKIEELVDALGTNAIPALIRGIQSAQNDEVARVGGYFLARFGDDLAAKSRRARNVAGEGDHHNDRTAAVAAVPAAVAIGSRPALLRREAIRAMLPLLQREKTVTVAFYALGHMRAAAAFDPAVTALDDEREMVRMRAAQALGRIGDRRAIPRLIPLLDDPLWDVRYAAADALVALGGSSVAPLRAAFDGATPRARRYIVEALAKLGDRAALPLGRVAWRDADPMVRTAVEKSLRDQMPWLRKGTRRQDRP